MTLKTFNFDYDSTASKATTWTANRQHEDGRNGIVGSSSAIRSVMEQIRTVAPADSTVLLQGETGTGKELFARAIHALSNRHAAPLVTLNCAAIPSGLLESELFGHERGAFTGAMTQRIGRFEMANGGTLFLDELGEMPMDLQVKLLRVLQEQEFERLGGTRTIRVNVRVVAATNRDLLQMVRAKEFRADLYYRLGVFPVFIPALRDRPDDIPELVRHFVAKYSERMNKVIEHIPMETMQAMVTYDWPGNVRQLQNFIEHGVIVSKGPVFQPPLGLLQSEAQSQSQSVSTSNKTLEDATRDHILQALEESRGVVGGRHGAAARLGIARTTLLSKMRRLGLESAGGELLNKGTSRPHAFATVA